MTEEDKFTVTSEMIRGFRDKAIEAKTSITGGHSVQNPWVMIGGVAMSVVPKKALTLNTA